jgi:hypothetical protein
LRAAACAPAPRASSTPTHPTTPTHVAHVLARLLVLRPVERAQLLEPLLVALGAVDVPRGRAQAKHEPQHEPRQAQLCVGVRQVQLDRPHALTARPLLLLLLLLVLLRHARGGVLSADTAGAAAAAAAATPGVQPALALQCLHAVDYLRWRGWHAVMGRQEALNCCDCVAGELSCALTEVFEGVGGCARFRS